MDGGGIKAHAKGMTLWLEKWTRSQIQTIERKRPRRTLKQLPGKLKARQSKCLLTMSFPSLAPHERSISTNLACQIVSFDPYKHSSHELNSFEMSQVSQHWPGYIRGPSRS